MSTQTDMLRAIAQGGPAGAGAQLPQVFNIDAWHAMQERDDQLIRDSILHGYTGKEYVYKFSIGNNEVTGVSVIGARQLAAEYGGIKSRIIASVDKTGSLFVFKSFEPINIQAQIIPQLADHEDFYEVVIEVSDIKSGNSIQVRKKETKTERKRNGDPYERPHYDVIAESKAYRNGVLSILPQSVIGEFEKRALAANNASKEKTLDQLREGVTAFCTKNAVALDRKVLEQLSYAQIMGLGSAANISVDAFKMAMSALGIGQQVEQIETKPAASDPKKGTDKPKPAAKQAIAEPQTASDTSQQGETGQTAQNAQKPNETVGEITAFERVKRLIDKSAKQSDPEIRALQYDEIRSLIGELPSEEQKTATKLLEESKQEAKQG